MPEEKATPSSVGRHRYRNVTCLAPMVRAGRLPLRLLALEHGVDLVYTEEIVDHKIIETRRIVNERLGTVDFVHPTDLDCPIFRTCDTEKAHVIFQLGTNDAQRALKACKLVYDLHEHDVLGVDINMGCPKSFSISGGMGAALLAKPDLIKEILTTLVDNLSVPVTCKIRVLADEEATLSLCRMIEATGVAAIGIHGRQKDERPRDGNRDAHIAYIAQRLTIPVIANGGSSELRSFVDIDLFRLRCCSSSVMVARQALQNVSIFDRRRTALKGKQETITDFLKMCARYDERFENVKYVVQRVLEGEQQTTAVGRAMLASDTAEEIYALWHVTPVWPVQKNTSQSRKRPAVDDTEEGGGGHFSDALLMDVTIPVKRLRKSPDSAKSTLYGHCKSEGMTLPSYETLSRDHSDKRHISCVTVGGKRYASTVRHVNKKLAEQAAASVAITSLNLTHLLPDVWRE